MTRGFWLELELELPPPPVELAEGDPLEEQAARAAAASRPVAVSATVLLLDLLIVNFDLSSPVLRLRGGLRMLRFRGVEISRGVGF
jgi:hypothetical protein